jgi:hypothetical protein
MSCVCLCDLSGHEVLGARVSGPHIARKAGRVCPNCRRPVEPGTLCIDNAGLYGDDDGGFFGRFHVPCFRLMEMHAERLCGGQWCWPFDLEEASVYAMAHGDDPFWRDWLFLYETIWEY